ncbi:MAG: nucleotidyltransferase family protein [Bacillota bacterium]
MLLQMGRADVDINIVITYNTIKWKYSYRMWCSVIREKFREFLEEILAQTYAYYGNRLVTLGVFGSVGRGKPRADSDIDLIIVAEGLPGGRLKRIQEFEQIEDKLELSMHRLKKSGINTYLSPVIKSPAEVKAGSLLFLDMIDDTFFLYDRQDYFRLFLQDFQKRLVLLGARKVKRGNSWHWVLKKDYRAGEVFDL